MYLVFFVSYIGEIQAWAKALDTSPDFVTAGNCSYELSHIGGEQPYGCTAGVRWFEGLGMVHVRNMDWPLKSIGKATRIFHFQKGVGGHSFSTVGVPGFVGALSGMVPGSYSATLNWAPPDGLPNFDYGPTFLLREVLERCSRYEEAVRTLSLTPLAASAFFVVCGTDRAVVIGRTKDDYERRVLTQSDQKAITQANHFTTNFIIYNGGVDVAYSKDRANTLARALNALKKPTSIDDVASCLDVEPVFNDNSYQQMAFAPSGGLRKVWRWVD